MSAVGCCNKKVNKHFYNFYNHLYFSLGHTVYCLSPHCHLSQKTTKVDGNILLKDAVRADYSMAITFSESI